jgi:hypothetical protein
VPTAVVDVLRLQLGHGARLTGQERHELVSTHRVGPVRRPRVEIGGSHSTHRPDAGTSSAALTTSAQHRAVQEPVTDAAKIRSSTRLTVMPYEIDQATRLRLARQSRLHSDDPLQFDLVVNEAALRRIVGGPEVMRAQLGHLLEVAGLPNVGVRVLPFAAGAHPATNGSFAVLEFPDEADPRIVCLDILVTTLYREGLREVGAYQLAHERLKAIALGPEDSAALVTQMIEEGLS